MPITPGPAQTGINRVLSSEPQIPYLPPLTTAVDPAERHSLSHWNPPTLNALWTLAGSSAQCLIDDLAPQLPALRLAIPTSLPEAEKTLVLIKQGLEASLLKADRDGVHIDNMLDSVDINDLKATIRAVLPPSPIASPRRPLRCRRACWIISAAAG